ncbi:MAG: SprT-like domain-containing protein [Chitinophagaceae bacterium]|nr:SprT-like domain-containing protein [Chitinophagaceae bacterium]
MALRRQEIRVIAHYLPPVTSEDVIAYLHQYGIQLSLKRERKSVLGDYRPAHRGHPHRISVNGNLNPYHLLITFLHELAHLITFIQYQQKVLPHGAEWKQAFSKLIDHFIRKNTFPENIRMALQKTLSNAAATTCSDPVLYRVLLEYDQENHQCLVEQLKPGDCFKTEKEQTFRMLEKRRTRYTCVEVSTGKKFLFPGIYTVQKL